MKRLFTAFFPTGDHPKLSAVNRVACIALTLILSTQSAPVAFGKHPPITAATFSRNGNELVLGSQAGVNVFAWPMDEISNGQSVGSEIENVHHIAFSPDEKLMLIAGGSPARHGTVELWNWPQRSLRLRATIGPDVINHAVWMPDSSKFITASADGRCRIVDTFSGKELLLYEDHSRAVLGIDLITAEQMAVSVGVDQTLRLWNTRTGEHLRTLDNHLDTIHGVLALPNPATPHPIVVTFGDDGTVRLWQPTIGRMMRFVKVKSTPFCATASSDGKTIYVGCDDGKVRAISTETMTVVGERATQLETIYGIMLTGNGQQLFASGSGGFEWFGIVEI